MWRAGTAARGRYILVHPRNTMFLFLHEHLYSSIRSVRFILSYSSSRRCHIALPLSLSCFLSSKVLQTKLHYTSTTFPVNQSRSSSWHTTPSAPFLLSWLLGGVFSCSLSQIRAPERMEAVKNRGRCWLVVAMSNIIRTFVTAQPRVRGTTRSACTISSWTHFSSAPCLGDCWHVSAQ